MFPGGAGVKNLPTVQETQEMRVQSLSQEDPPEEEMVTNSSNLVWEIPWTKEPDGLQSMSRRELDTTALSTCMWDAQWGGGN